MGILRLLGIGLCWGVLLVVIGVAVGSFVVYSRINNEVQKYVLAQLQEQYPDLDILVGSAQIVENRGFIIRNIEFSVPNTSRSLKLLHIEELFVEVPVTLQTLYQKHLRISRIVIKAPILRASRASDGTFPELQLLLGNEADPLFLFPEEGQPIVVEIENGNLLYDDARQSTQPLRLSGINITVTPEMQDRTSRILVKGSADGDFFRRLTFEAEVLPATMQWRISANCRHFYWSNDLWQYLPSNSYIQERPLFQGQFDFYISAVSDPISDWGYRFDIGGTLMHGRLDLPDTNRTFTELSTRRFEITNDGIAVDRLTGNSDGAQFAADFVQEGLTFFGDPRQRAELIVSIRNLRFDDQQIEALSPFLNDTTEQLLAKFDYEGTTDLYAQLSCRNGTWRPKTVEMHVSEVGFAYREFPYRLDRLAGNLFIDETAALHLRLTTKQDAALKAVIEGHYSNVFVDPAGKIEIIGEDIPIDQKLIRTLPSAVQQVVTSLNPTGKLKSRLIFELPPGDVPLNKQFDIALDHVSLRYDHFPYPLRDVTGSLHFDGNTWQFRDVSGINGTAVIKGNGSLYPIGGVYETAQEFVLHISAEELPIDDQITQALLNPDQRQLLQSLNVNGKVNLDTQIQYRTDNRNLNLSFQAIPRAGLSIQPDRFPYRIENIDGTIQYENGRVFAETLTGTHRNTSLRSRLDCRFNVEGQSILQLSPLTIDQLQANRELLDALPVYLRDFLDPLEITRPFNLSGGIEYRQSEQGKQTVLWDLNCILFQNSAKLGMHFENICGIIRLTGQSVGEQLLLDGELNLDSLMVNGFQATSVRGPFFFRGRNLQLGVPAGPMRARIPVTGRFCEGTIHADGLVMLGSGTLGSGMSYNINADLIGADLAKIVREVEPTVQTTAGTLNGNLRLQGIGTKWETVSGTGTLQLRNANIYGVPVMLRLLRELRRIRNIDPDAGMFSSMDVGFRISGLQMFFDSVIFEGGAISLYGDGMMQLENRQVDLTMKTRLGNRRAQIPIISDIIGGVGDQLVQLKVTGPLNDPTVFRVLVPEVQGALQQRQTDEDIPPPPPSSRNRLAPSKMFQWNPF